MTEALDPYKAELDRLCRRFHVQRLELFGSAATGRHSEDSDLDFLIEFAPLERGAYAEAYFGLRESLERLFGRKIDLVIASAITNPYFRQSIEQTKVLVYAA